MLRLRLLLSIGAALAAPTTRPTHAVAETHGDYLVTEVLAAEPSDYVSDYDPDMKEQKKVLKALREENRVAALKNAEYGAKSAPLVHKHRDEDEEPEEMGDRMAKRKSDHERLMEAHKAEHEKQMKQKSKQHEKRKADREELANAEGEEGEEDQNDGKWVADEPTGNDGKYHPKDEAWKQDKKDAEAPSDSDPASLARFLAGLPGGATGPAARMATRTAERTKMKVQRQTEKAKMKAQKDELRASDEAKKEALKKGVTEPSPEPVASTETSAEWYSKATKKLHSTKKLDDNGLPKKRKEHSEVWKSKHDQEEETVVKLAKVAKVAKVAKAAKDDDKKVHGGTASPAEETPDEPGSLDSFDFNKAATHGISKKKSKRSSQEDEEQTEQ